jgi:hypothetical protein
VGLNLTNHEHKRMNLRYGAIAMFSLMVLLGSASLFSQSRSIPKQALTVATRQAPPSEAVDSLNQGLQTDLEWASKLFEQQGNREDYQQNLSNLRDLQKSMQTIP